MKKDYDILLNSGERVSFQCVFKQYYNTLVLFCCRFLNSREESESIVQDAFLDLWEACPTFPSELSIRVYLYTTVRNKALNVMKHQRVIDSYTRDRLQDKEADVYYMRSVIEEETRRLVFQAIEMLPEQCRQVCLLNLDGFDNQQIANEMGISINTVKFHKKNAYKILREKLKDCFYLLLFL